ncbi:MAG: OmpA family protein, partial [Bacteroidia bacterium]
MKSLFFILLLFTSLFVLGQNNKFTITGTVTECKTKLPINDIDIDLVCSDGQSIHTKTNIKGEYKIESRSKKNTLACILKSNAPFPYTSQEKCKLTFYDSLLKNDTTISFCLIKTKGCTYGPPLIYFKKNAIDFQSGTNIDDTISFIYQMLMDNPNLVVQISGNASKDEKNPQKLAMQRADLIRNLLIKQGIEPERLIAKSNSDLIPSYTYDDDTL